MILLNEFLDEPPALPSVQQQITLIEQAEDEKSSAFSIPQEAIDAILQQGSGVQDGKYRIYLHYQTNGSAKENADFLKNEYGIGGRAPSLTGTDIHEWHDGKGITLTSGKIIGPDARDTVTIKAEAPDAPAWVRETGDVTITREGDIVTIDRGGEGEKSYVEFDLELPDGQDGEMEKQPAEKEMAVGMEFAIEDRRYAIDAIDEEAGTVSLRDITFQNGVGFPIFHRESIDFVRDMLNMPDEDFLNIDWAEVKHNLNDPNPYTVSDEPPMRGKDYNDYLKMTITKNPLHER